MNALQIYHDTIRKRQRSVTQLEDLQPQIARLDRVLKTIGRFVEGRTMFIGEQILICVKVNKIAEIEPVLDVLQEELEIEFDRSEDAAQQGWRVFHSKNAPWLRVDAELRADGPECRRVIVGYESVPKYEIRCGEDADAPDAAPPADELKPGGTD